MNYKGKELKTFDEIFQVALRLAKENKEEAQEFFKQYVQLILDSSNEAIEEAEAEDIAKLNFGYFSSYFDQETCDIIYNTYQCCHPFFGDKPFES